MKNFIDNYIEEEYKKLTEKELYNIHQKYIQLTSGSMSDISLLDKLDKFIFKKKPPTPEEFLDPKNGWIPYKDIWPHVKQDFLNILNNNKNYFQLVFYGSTRLGKCSGLNTPVLMYDLSIKMVQDIQVGDLLMGPDSKPRKVLETHSGHGPLYKVKQNKADDYIVNENHILTLQYTNIRKAGANNGKYTKDHSNNGKIIDIPIKEYLQLSKSKKHILKGVKAKLNFPEQKVEIDPYWLGIYLGDGCKYHTSITTMDSEIKDYIYKYAEQLNLKVSVSNNCSKASSYKICGTKQINTQNNINNINNNTLFYHLRDTYNILHNKHIPIEYLRNSEEIRLQLLAGIIDSDGHLSKKGDVVEISQVDKRLSDQICFLSRSLGFRTTIREKKFKTKFPNNDKVYEGVTYRITLFGDLYKIPTKVKRKQSEYKKSRINPLLTGIQVEEYGEGEYFGFEVDGDHRYLHSDLTITHNSFMSVLLMMYTIVYIHHLREPALFYGLSPGTSLAMYIISFNKSKPKEIYLDPLYDYLENAPRFERVIQTKQVSKKQKEIGIDRIVWSSADISSSGHLTLDSGLTIRTGNKNPNDIIGANVIQAYISEIAFFIEEAGASEDKIFELYTNSYSRIRATVGKDYLTWVLLDSSANYADSKIEKHIIEKLQYSEDTYFQWRWQWAARPWDFPVYYKGLQELGILNRVPTEEENKILLEKGLVFRVITGNGSIKAKFVKSDNDLQDIPPDLIDYPPIDVYTEYENNLIKSIKDIGGKPTSNESKFIQNIKLIDNMFDTRLTNIEHGIVADAASVPENLIWEQIVDKFFTTSPDGSYHLIRAPYETRFLSIDTAHSYKGDVYGFCLGHLEFSTKLNETMFITDFNFPLLPGKEGINLTASELFITDLITKGNINLHTFSTDTFQSAQMKQNLKRFGINILSLSVDTSLEPYQRLLTCLLTNTIKSGRNIFCKNNLKCIERKRVMDKDNNLKGEKIDHPKGNTNNIYDGDWSTSTCGINAKDVSDTLAACSYSAFESGIRPLTIYEHENKRLYDSYDPLLLHEQIQDAIKIIKGY